MSTPVAALQGPALASVLDLARDRHAEGISVQDLADHAGYSPFHFTRMFTAAMRMPPGQYLTAIRIDAAKRLLLSGDDAVIDVATAVGFDSLSSFSRRFRATVGVPPGGLRALADKVADRPARPFRLADDTLGPQVSVELQVPSQALPRGDMAVWVGWYPQPAPIGLPAAGALVEYGDRLSLPLCPGNPWLLGFALPMHAEVHDQLVPATPLVAVHPGPITQGGRVRLIFDPTWRSGIPLLSALPILCRGR